MKTPGCIARFDEGKDETTDACPALLRDMRDTLNCDVCHGVLAVPMMLKVCGHTFCARCIRKYLEAKGPVNGDCPSCREKVTPDELVLNVKLKEVIAQYNALDTALSVAPIGAAALTAAAAPAAAAGGTKRRRSDSGGDAGSDSDFENPPSSQGRRAAANAGRKKPRAAAPAAPAPVAVAEGGRRSGRLSSRRPAAAPPCSPEVMPADVVDLSDDIPLEIGPSSGAGAGGVGGGAQRLPSGGDAGRVSCPICRMSISERNINTHINTCLDKPQAAPRRSASPVQAEPAAAVAAPPAAAAAAPAGPASRMPKMSYHVLKDARLRQLCKDLGLSTIGDKAQLTWRHRQYTQEHNIACDAQEAPNPEQNVDAVEQMERALAADAKPKKSIFKRQNSRTHSGTEGAAAASDSGQLELSQVEAFEELIAGIEKREGRTRKRVYTYVYESDEESEGGPGPAADAAGATLAMFRLNGAGGQVDLRVEANGIRLTGASAESSEQLPFAGLSWELTGGGLTLMWSAGGAVKATERQFACPRETAEQVQGAVILAMQAARQQAQQPPPEQPQQAEPEEQQPGSGSAADRTDSAENSAVSPPAEAPAVTAAAADGRHSVSSFGLAGAAESSAEHRECRICYCAEGELESTGTQSAVAAGGGSGDPADLLQPCNCTNWIHRRCLREWIASRTASTDKRMECEVCNGPIAAADRAGALQAAPEPTKEELAAVGIRKCGSLCGHKSCAFAGKGQHYHCVSGHEMGGRACIYVTDNAKKAEKHGMAMVKLAEKRRRASEPALGAWSRSAA